MSLESKIVKLAESVGITGAYFVGETLYISPDCATKAAILSLAKECHRKFGVRMAQYLAGTEEIALEFAFGFDNKSAL